MRGYCWEKVEYLPLVGFFIGVAALYPRMLGSLATSLGKMALLILHRSPFSYKS